MPPLVWLFYVPDAERNARQRAMAGHTQGFRIRPPARSFLKVNCVGEKSYHMRVRAEKRRPRAFNWPVTGFCPGKPPALCRVLANLNNWVYCPPSLAIRRHGPKIRRAKKEEMGKAGVPLMVPGSTW